MSNSEKGDYIKKLYKQEIPKLESQKRNLITEVEELEVKNKIKKLSLEIKELQERKQKLQEDNIK
tara:strand:+ start:575 stop:769 length:195 start_codon:yes stop_codon:yes gene_type:complete